ncbi:MAG TPA: hypothetical protein PKY56_03555 [Candidatus Kapabacteria bacterium]|nr:hypothetical protein [Candidatus Kapabacteria bacterium]HPO61931.1 hypothetical protein [Candidatus Kapabacteria bacterium]
MENTIEIEKKVKSSNNFQKIDVDKTSNWKRKVVRIKINGKPLSKTVIENRE